MNTCFDCSYFCIWDGDPVCSRHMCFHLPIDNDCIFKLPTTDILTKLHIDQWNNIKSRFFSEFTISPDLKENYLSVFPDDKDLINT